MPKSTQSDDPEQTFSFPVICIRDQPGSGLVLDFGPMVLTAGGPGWRSGGWVRIRLSPRRRLQKCRFRRGRVGTWLNHAITSYDGLINRSGCKALEQRSKFGAKSFTALGSEGIQAQKRHILFPPVGRPKLKAPKSLQSYFN
jgi:hypothetical protein